MATGNEIGRALYRILQGETPPPEDEFPIHISHTETRRIARKRPDGTFEIVEEIIHHEEDY